MICTSNTVVIYKCCFDPSANFLPKGYCHHNGVRPSIHTLVSTGYLENSWCQLNQMWCVGSFYGELGYNCIWVTLTYFQGHRGQLHDVYLYSQCQLDILILLMPSPTKFGVYVPSMEGLDGIYMSDLDLLPRSQGSTWSISWCIFIWSVSAGYLKIAHA